MNKYKFHWRDGVVSEGEGVNASDAFTKLGYGAGALPALDYYEVVAQPGQKSLLEKSVN